MTYEEHHAEMSLKILSRLKDKGRYGTIAANKSVIFKELKDEYEKKWGIGFDLMQFSLSVNYLLLKLQGEGKIRISDRPISEWKREEEPQKISWEPVSFPVEEPKAETAPEPAPSVVEETATDVFAEPETASEEPTDTTETVEEPAPPVIEQPTPDVVAELEPVSEGPTTPTETVEEPKEIPVIVNDAKWLDRKSEEFSTAFKVLSFIFEAVLIFFILVAGLIIFLF